MNNIGKIIATQGVLGLLDGSVKLTPEQKNYAEDRRKRRFDKLRRQYGIQKSTAIVINKLHESTRESLLANPLKHVSSWSKLKFAVLSHIMNQAHHLEYEAGVSQERMALDLGCGRQRVNELIRELTNEGLISKNTYGRLLSRPGIHYVYRENCTYEVSSYLYRNKIASKLCQLIPALKKLRSLYKPIAISLLFVNSLALYPKISCLSEYTTVSNRYIYKYNLYSNKRTRVEESELPYNASPPGKDDMEVPILSDILRHDVTPRLQLTKEGQFKMSAFDDGTLLYALHGLDVLGNGQLENDFPLFVSLCEEYIRAHLNAVDYGKPDRLMKQFNFTPKGKLYLEEGWRQPGNTQLPQATTNTQPSYKASAHEYKKKFEPRQAKPVIPVIPMPNDLKKNQEPEPKPTSTEPKQLSLNPMWANELLAIKDKLKF